MIFHGWHTQQDGGWDSAQLFVQVTNVNTSAEVQVTGVEDKPEQFYNLTALTPLEVRSWYKIEIDFQSYVNASVRGLYQAKYITETGAERYALRLQLMCF